MACCFLLQIVILGDTFVTPCLRTSSELAVVTKFRGRSSGSCITHSFSGGSFRGPVRAASQGPGSRTPWRTFPASGPSCVHLLRDGSHHADVLLGLSQRDLDTCGLLEMVRSRNMGPGESRHADQEPTGQEHRSMHGRSTEQAQARCCRSPEAAVALSAPGAGDISHSWPRSPQTTGKGFPDWWNSTCKGTEV